MTKTRKTRCKKGKDWKNLEFLELLTDEKPEGKKNEEITKELKMLKIRIVLCEKNLNEKPSN